MEISILPSGTARVGTERTFYHVEIPTCDVPAFQAWIARYEIEAADGFYQEGCQLCGGDFQLPHRPSCPKYTTP